MTNNTYKLTRGELLPSLQTWWLLQYCPSSQSSSHRLLLGFWQDFSLLSGDSWQTFLLPFLLVQSELLTQGTEMGEREIFFSREIWKVTSRLFPFFTNIFSRAKLIIFTLLFAGGDLFTSFQSFFCFLLTYWVWWKMTVSIGTTGLCNHNCYSDLKMKIDSDLECNNCLWMWQTDYPWHRATTTTCRECDRFCCLTGLACTYPCQALSGSQHWLNMSLVRIISLGFSHVVWNDYGSIIKLGSKAWH